MADKRKPMRRTVKKEMGTTSILLQLYQNKLLCSKVDEALDEGVIYEEIVELCASYDLEISAASLTRYKDKRKEAIETGVPIESLLDKRKKTGNIIDIKDKKVRAIDERQASFDNTFDQVETVYNDLQLLDEVIQKGYNGLQFTETIEMPIALRAIEIKAKLTNNSMQGLSLVGLRELKLRVSARTSAMTEVLLQYIPEEKHEEVLEAIERCESEYYANLDLTAEDQRITDGLKQAGLDF